jgi:hypothetical protein
METYETFDHCLAWLLQCEREEIPIIGELLLDNEWLSKNVDVRYAAGQPFVSWLRARGWGMNISELGGAWKEIQQLFSLYWIGAHSRDGRWAACVYQGTKIVYNPLDGFTKVGTPVQVRQPPCRAYYLVPVDPSEWRRLEGSEGGTESEEAGWRLLRQLDAARAAQSRAGETRNELARRANWGANDAPKSERRKYAKLAQEEWEREREEREAMQALGLEVLKASEERRWETILEVFDGETE